MQFHLQHSSAFTMHVKFVLDELWLYLLTVCASKNPLFMLKKYCNLLKTRSEKIALKGVGSNFCS